LNGQESESTQSRILTIRKTPRRALLHFRALGLIVGTAIIMAILSLILDKDNGLAGDYYDTCARWLTVIAGAFAIWLLIRDWFISGNMTFLFDGDREVFCVQDKNRIPIQLSFKAINRIKIEESSNVFPVYTLSIHLQDGQIIEIDASAKQAEINLLADRIAETTGAEIVIQRYNEPLSKEEKEDQARRRQNEIWKGD
jgi:hypothetical protein